LRLTAAGRQALEEDLERAEVERLDVSRSLADARALGNDPTENLDLRDAMDRFSQLETRIADLRAMLAAAEPLDLSSPADGLARMGTTVRLRHADGEEAEYLLVSPPEAAPRRGRISVDSPIGRAVVGHRAGEHLMALTPGGNEEVELLKVA
jgi:transcription elongation factor GreA